MAKCGGVFLFLALGFFACPVWSKLPIRLVKGKESYMGRVEVFHGNRWGEICDQGWNMADAKVVCRMLGYPDATRFTFGDWFGRGKGFFWLDGIRCNGNESRIEDCEHKPWGDSNCTNEDVAGVVCKQHDRDLIISPSASVASGKVKDLEVRLQGPIVNDQIKEGILQVKINDKWGHVCSQAWVHKNARVACGMLGYVDYVKVPIRPPNYSSNKDEIFLMSEVACSGTESSLIECNHEGWGDIKCEKGLPVYIKCVPSDPVKQFTTVRLRSGAQLWEGRVEVTNKRYPKQWGSVCDDHFSLVDGSVACRALGWGSAKRVYRNAWFGQGTGKVYMDDVACNGRENTLQTCRHRDHRRGNCKNHYEDVGVECHAPKLYGHEIRLVGGASEMEGRVEVLVDNQWGTVCGDSWELDEAIVTCRHLDLGFAEKAVTPRYPNAGELRMSMAKVRCTGKERSLLHCKHARHVLACRTAKRAAVKCVKKLADLVVNAQQISDDRNYRLDVVPLSYLTCAYEENCLSESASRAWKLRDYNSNKRRLLRFSNRIENRGLDHFRPFEDKSQWQWHACHKHYHSMEVFSTYDLIDQRGRKAGHGHKAGFCLEDTKCDPGIEMKWNCTDGGDQGVSPNCYDIYKWTIDCQWIDVTDHPHGNYQLRIQVNPDRFVPESDYDNNIVLCDAFDYGDFLLIKSCHLDHCDSGIRTEGGNAFGACCHFPFTYLGKTFHSCTTFLGIKRPWCATTYDFAKDKTWGSCVDRNRRAIG